MLCAWLAYTAGVNLKYAAAPPDFGDPFYCPFDPITNRQIPRTVTMQLQCNPAVSGGQEIQAIQNASNVCECVGGGGLCVRVCAFVCVRVCMRGL